MFDVLIFVAFVTALCGAAITVASDSADKAVIGLCMFVYGASGVILILLRRHTKIGN